MPIVNTIRTFKGCKIWPPGWRVRDNIANFAGEPNGSHHLRPVRRRR